MIRLPASSRLLSTSLRPTLFRPSCRCLATTAGAPPQGSQQSSPTPGDGAGQRRNQQHAVSNPTLANIEKRWEQMPPQEQAELWMALRDRMTVDWHDMTMQEKKASYWVAFGPHGPRKLADPGEKWEVFRLFMYAMIASTVVFAALRYFARPPPKTMSREWQEKTNEYLKAQGTEAITGVSSEGYTGKGMIQSRSRPDLFKEEEEE